MRNVMIYASSFDLAQDEVSVGKFNYLILHGERIYDPVGSRTMMMLSDSNSKIDLA